MNSNPLFEQLDNKFRAFLRSHGLTGTRHRETILKVLLDNPKPSLQGKSTIRSRL